MRRERFRQLFRSAQEYASKKWLGGLQTEMNPTLRPVLSTILHKKGEISRSFVTG